ncbi:MAG: DUF3604 domain-containing protein [candidate division KSB1 bacterium]|nr:DUF3604 domain-containing protein [candidate division KSB1 bacterium]MDZ7275634.1 DUF3604 domain-containing protein [candidate division KSB1 bacterium]MDZ7284675.1 DUF3604 domain-containing protein [candidate division KSB1 bacterium]MDZ7297906.1 DUF3604 domain-containing protein [candidate division KSB1 bacterium]MDZ7305966.1 DUF3604 domain-containing protein [candidate division KSB1 bacterium]
MTRQRAYLWGMRFCAALLLLAVWIGLSTTGRSGGPDFTATVEPTTAIAKSRDTWTVRLRVETDSVRTGATIKCRFIKGFGEPQNSDSLRRNYVAVRTTNPGARVAITSLERSDAALVWDWDRNAWIVTVKVTAGSLRRGDMIELIYGANRPHGRMSAPPSAFVDTMNIAYDLNGSGVFQEILSPPVLHVKPGMPHQLAAYLPSQAVVGEAIRLRVVILDEEFNLVPEATARLFLSTGDAQAHLLSSTSLTLTDSGRLDIPVTFMSTGTHRVNVQAQLLNSDTQLVTESNPVRVTATAPPYRIFWGDLHSHSRISHDGHGTGSFAKARDVAGLDFYAPTEHTSTDYADLIGITPAEWQEIKAQVVKYNQPGSFVTLLGYEYSRLAPSGHHNVYFNGTDAALAQLPLYQEQLLGEVQELWRRLERVLPPGVEFLTVPHHTGIMWSPASNSAVSFGPGFGHRYYRPLIEIYSSHGQSELYAPDHPLAYEKLQKEGRASMPGPHYAQDAWAAGEVLGSIASSDDHSARPGLPFRGLTAVLAPELTRDAIFQALRQRRVYATTGQRLLLDFTIADRMMGSRLEMPPGTFPLITAEVIGTDSIAFMEVLKWNMTRGRWHNGHPVFEVIRHWPGEGLQMKRTVVDSSYAGDTVYYLRVKQHNEVYDMSRQLNRQVWAWSSPIWVMAPNPLDTTHQQVPPRELRLSASYPNPNRGQTQINFYLPVAGRATLRLFDTLGREVAVMFDGVESEGWYATRLDTQALANGLYFLRLQAAGRVLVQRLLVMK